jgi:hypothetical protein
MLAMLSPTPATSTLPMINGSWGLMAEHRSTKPPQRKDEDDSPPPPENTKDENRSKDISAITADVLNDIDKALEKALDFSDDEIVTDKEREEREQRFVTAFVQKGGE